MFDALAPLYTKAVATLPEDTDESEIRSAMIEGILHQLKIRMEP